MQFIYDPHKYSTAVAVLLQSLREIPAHTVSMCISVSLPSPRRHVQRVHSSEVQESGGSGSYTHSSGGCTHCFRLTVDLIFQYEDAYSELLGKGFWKLFRYNFILFLVLFKVVVISLFNQIRSGEILFKIILVLLFYLHFVLNF